MYFIQKWYFGNCFKKIFVLSCMKQQPWKTLKRFEQQGHSNEKLCFSRGKTKYLKKSILKKNEDTSKSFRRNVIDDDYVFSSKLVQWKSVRTNLVLRNLVLTSQMAFHYTNQPDYSEHIWSFPSCWLQPSLIVYHTIQQCQCFIG